MRKLILALAVMAIASACTTVPAELEGSYRSISPARVDGGVLGSQVRWGGVIVDTRNEEDVTCLEILSRELGKYLRPQVSDRTAGRFIACKPGFYDPEVYSKGREVTLTGRISRIEVRQIDEFSYRYPVVEVDELVLWEKRQDVRVYDHYDPFYSPYYWGYGPYRGYYYYYYPFYRSPGFGVHGRATIRKTVPDPAETKAGD
ncbi:MAG: Slp family lipoprotein [Xanthomonadales bacterium]|nr:Slp family lipoprotein [Xanthomonadales bacterium]